jgi:thioesterase domain-containing protein
MIDNGRFDIFFRYTFLLYLLPLATSIIMIPAPEVPDDQARLCNTVLGIIAEELDIPVEELQDNDIVFSEVGIDLIVAPRIVARISQTTGLQLPENVFQEFPDVGHLKQLVTTTLALNSPKTTRTNNHGRALSVLIQGNRARATKNMFLLPDGSGSALAYARSPPISPECCLYALNSPFLQETNSYTCSIEDIASIWTQEIRNIQPHGPYIIGGWSAGGYYAYEVMKHFHREGEVVEKLIFIDSPCRTDFEAMPLDVFLYLSSHNLMGNWGSMKPPQWLLNHFEATLRAVNEYKPISISLTIAVPEVFIIWASDALLGDDTAARTGLDLDVKVTRFLLQPRADFGPNGWEKLLPGGSIAIATVPGHHFNITHPPNASSFDCEMPHP